MTQGGLHSLPSISTLSYLLYLHTLLPSLYLCSALCLSSISTRYYPLYIPSISTLFDPFYSLYFSPLYLLSFFLSLSPISLLSQHSCVPYLSLSIFYLHSLQSHLYLPSPLYFHHLPLYIGVASLICSLFPSIFPPTARETAPLTDYFLSEENCQKASVD
jgi:hypothetical protein